MKRNNQKTSMIRTREAGFSLIEVFVVATIIGVLTAVTIPQLAGQRRLHRSSAVTREIVTQIRYARQKAMAERCSFTFQYNNTTKAITIIDNNASGATVLNDSNYPNNTGSAVVLTSSLTQMGLPSSEISYGIPTGLPTTALSDGVSKTSLTSSKVNITFQPNGSVVDANGNPIDIGLFMYNNKIANDTASAITVLGAAGRIKLWKYDSTSNTYKE